MNLLPLLAALLPWAGSPTSALSRIFAAVSLLSIEMQVVTLTGAGTLRTLAPINLVVAALLVAWQARRGRPCAGWSTLRGAVPWGVALPLGGLVLALNLALPLEAADPYHLDRAAQIERLGTLAYDATVDPKVNIVGWVYELLLADVRQLPWAGDVLVRLHGVFGLLLYGVAVASVHTSFLPGGPRWAWAVLFAVPVLFHQFVLIKNDLFLTAPALVALAWFVTRADRASWRDAAWAGWLAAFAVAGKIVGFSLALVMLAGLLLARQRGDRTRPLGGLALGGLLGGLTGGLFFSWVQNARSYGDPLANQVVAEIGNLSTSVGEAFLSLGRFGVSLVYMGFLTPAVWPGRRGWGSTFGLPLMWALVVLMWHYRRAREARWALWSAVGCFSGFAALYPDADLTQRLVLAPGLLLVGVAVHLLDREDVSAARARVALVPVLALSGAQDPMQRRPVLL